MKKILIEKYTYLCMNHGNGLLALSGILHTSEFL